MSRRKVNSAEQLVCKIGLRVSKPFYQKMEGWLAHSNCRSVAELARAILYKEQIIWYHKDTSLETLTVQLTAIRKELNAIGNNINQATRYFNGTNVPGQKIYTALKILDEYRRVSDTVEKIESLLDVVTKNGRKGD